MGTGFLVLVDQGITERETWNSFYMKHLTNEKKTTNWRTEGAGKKRGDLEDEITDFRDDTFW